MKREFKRQIREDEVRSSMEHAYEFVVRNQRQVSIAAVALALLGLGVWGARTWQERQTQAAELAFSDAMRIYLTPTVAEVPEGAGSTVTPFATKAEKLTKAIAAFDGVDRAHGSSASGRRARYFAAVARLEAGDSKQAEEALKQLALAGATLESGLARLALADLYRRAGQVEKAVETLRQIVDAPASEVPRDAALLELGATYEAAQRPAEARAAYERLTKDFPSSVYAAEARRRADFLETAVAS
ncbi:MAG: tol-pal system YbgF family protein [Vicinamibacteria bacterium]